ncbi:hypothetical protein O5D80_004064 [Batrachochytrium dendrobatidis]|nr:hypothetical protein O5D80_004064 [Batrachochytrium dendrobatidis]
MSREFNPENIPSSFSQTPPETTLQQKQFKINFEDGSSTSSRSSKTRELSKVNSNSQIHYTSVSYPKNDITNSVTDSAHQDKCVVPNMDETYLYTARASQISNPFATPRDSSLPPHPRASRIISSTPSNITQQGSNTAHNSQSMASPTMESAVSNPFATPLMSAVSNPFATPLDNTMSPILESAPPSRLNQSSNTASSHFLKKKSSKNGLSESQTIPHSKQHLDQAGQCLGSIESIQETHMLPQLEVDSMQLPRILTKKSYGKDGMKKSTDALHKRDRSKSRKTAYHVQSPTTNEFVAIPMDDITDLCGNPVHYKSKSKLSHKKLHTDIHLASTINLNNSDISAMTGRSDDGLKTMASITNLTLLPLNENSMPVSDQPISVVYVQEKSGKRLFRKSMGGLRKAEGSISPNASTGAPNMNLSRVNWQDQLCELAKFTNSLTYTILLILHSLYAGLCLYSLVLFPLAATPAFPTTSPLKVNQTINLNDTLYTTLAPQILEFQVTALQDVELLTSTSFRFLVFYSMIANGLSLLFQLGSLAALMSTLNIATENISNSQADVLVKTNKINGDDTAHQSMMDLTQHMNIQTNSGFNLERPLPPIPTQMNSVNADAKIELLRFASVFDTKDILFTLSTNWQLFCRILIVSTATVSFIFNALMIPIDMRISQSGTDGQYGGAYGMPNWYFDPSKITQDLVVMDLRIWIACNIVRGVFGIVCWIVCIVLISWKKVMRTSSMTDRNYAIKRRVGQGIMPI